MSSALREQRASRRGSNVGVAMHLELMMKPASTVHARLLERLAEAERQLAGWAVPEKGPSVTIDMAKFATVSRERWESLGKAAQDPTIKLVGQAIISID